MAALIDDEESFVVLNNDTDLISLTNTTKSLELTNEIEKDKIASTSTCSFPSIPPPIQLDESIKDEDDSTSSVELYPDKVDFLMEEIQRLKELNQLQTAEIKKQYEAVMVWRDDVLKVHELNKKKYDGMKNLIENLKSENSELKSIQEALKEELNLLKKEKLRYELLKEEFNQQEKPPINSTNEDKLAQEIEKFKIDQVELHDRIEEGLKINDQLRVQLLKKEEKERELIQQLQALKKDTENDPKEVQLLQEKLMAAQMHITELDCVSERNLEMLDDKQKQIDELQTKVNEMSEAVENFDLMKTQLDAYKTDFEAEREAKLGYKDENDSLLIRCEDLRKEVERLEASSEATCPICNKHFQNIERLERHVQICIPSK